MYQAYFDKVKQASRGMAHIGAAVTSEVITDLSEQLKAATDIILTANQKDLERMDAADPRYDRLKLTSERIVAIANDLVSVAQLPCPVGEVLEQRTLDNGLKLEKKRVPLGVVGVIYEARPNVTIDVFALCLRSGTPASRRRSLASKEVRASLTS